MIASDTFQNNLSVFTTYSSNDGYTRLWTLEIESNSCVFFGTESQVIQFSLLLHILFIWDSDWFHEKSLKLHLIN